MSRCLTCFFSFVSLCWVYATDLAPLPEDPFFAPYRPLVAPPVPGLQLRVGDRLAICGDSITEQKMYSRIIETYLTVCAPELAIEVRQFGWSGERAPGFLARMTNDVLRFGPTIATTCYGMNDHRYQPSSESIREEYRDSSAAILHSFKSHNVRVIQGSAGTIGKIPHWVTEANGTVTDLNLGLLELRNIDVLLARQEAMGFADVFLTMLIAGHQAQQRYGPDYHLPGKDGVHPDWAGQTVMGFAFLKSMGLDGHIATITLNLDSGEAHASAGHRIVSAEPGQVLVESMRYPFCATGPLDQDSSIRSGMTLVPFHQELNRFMLILRNPRASRYHVTWGTESRIFPAATLAEGINLAEEFELTPFSDAFKRVDEAVARKQAYETRQIKDLFHGPEGRMDPETTAALTERVRQSLLAAVRTEMQPVQHRLLIQPE